ncbi:MAG: polysaccharide deacetylase family protein [Erysipelotrichales bacterium]|nr:polysaccharide deacetylase family protein [Erysipelotrichales bacterium]
MKKLFFILTIAFAFIGQSLLSENLSAETYGFGFKRSRDFIRACPGEKIKAILAQYNSYYIGKDEKIMYLTFDCGYENGFTPQILDSLKEFDIAATFFVTGGFIKKNPELISRMIDEGHILANHTNQHKNMAKISEEEILLDLEENNQIFKEATGQELSRFIRPPEGQFSETSLRITSEQNYINVFWSISHVDWYVDDQPSNEASLTTLVNQIHNGGIILLHNISRANAEILRDFIEKCHDLEYSFRNLDYLIQD